MLMRLNTKRHILVVHVITKVQICLISEKIKSKKLGFSSICWLMICPNACFSALFTSVWSCKIFILYGNRWRFWCFMRTGELERSVSWDKRLVDILGDCCKHYLRVNDLIFCPDWPWPSIAIYNVIHPSPWICPGGTLCESGWSV